jgi:hypothetical protein
VSAAPPAHEYALLTPWYVIGRSLQLQQLALRPRRPFLQKYDSPEFVRQIMTDATVSLPFVETDQWATPIPIPLARRQAATGKAKLVTHSLQRSNLTKLYQPSHNRFYTLTTELFCEEPGLPRPSRTDGVEVGFVMRRILFKTSLTTTQIRKFLQDRGPTDITPVTDHDLGDVFGAQLGGHPTEAGLVQVQRVVEAWTVDASGRGSWRELDDKDNKADHNQLVHGGDPEQTMSMWRIPARASDCATAATRSLWFGVVPTFSSEHAANGSPKLDDNAIYELRCFVRRLPAAGHEDCPQPVWWSDVSESFRLASFFDPEGTRNRTATIKMPDLRTLASQAGLPPSGGVAFETPPGSNLKFDADGKIPTGGSVGSDGEICLFSIELLTIVAKFVFSIFLPIVTFVFQLWWMLLLRFCWPTNAQAKDDFQAFFAGKPDPSPPTDGLPKSQAKAVVDALPTATEPPKRPDTADDPLSSLPDPLCALEVQS